MNTARIMPYLISGIMALTLPGATSAQNNKILLDKNLVANADMAHFSTIEAYDISGYAADLAERLCDTIIALGTDDISKIKALRAKNTGKAVARARVLGRGSPAQYCVYGWSKNIAAGFGAYDMDMDFSAIKKGDASNTTLARLKDKYCQPEFSECFLSGKLYFNDADFAAARDAYIQNKIDGLKPDSTEIASKIFALENEFQKNNFSIAQVSKGALVLFRSDRNRGGSGLHATMFTGTAENPTVSAFNGEHLGKPIQEMATALSPRNASGNAVSGVEVINLPELTQILLEMRGREIIRMQRPQLLEYIAENTSTDPAIMDQIQKWSDTALQRLCLDILYRVTDRPFNPKAVFFSKAMQNQM